MKHVKSIAAGIVAAGALGVGALGIGSGVASAAPQPGIGWAQDYWGPHGHWDGPWDGDGDRGWGPPPPPAPYYGYGAYDNSPPCLSGPLGFVQLCA